MPPDAADRRRVASRAWPFLLVGVGAIALQPLTGGTVAPARWWLGVAASALGLAMACRAMLVPGATAAWQVAAGLTCVLGIALARDGAGGAASGFDALALLPVAWSTLYGTRRQLYVILAGVVVASILPIVAIGGPAYPAEAWRSTIVLVAVALMFGLAAQDLRDALASGRAELARRAAQLTGALESIADPIARYEVVRGPQGAAVDLRCVFANPRAVDMIGIRATGELLGERLAERGQSAMLRSWLDAARGTTPVTFELTSQRWRPGRAVVLTLTPVPDGLVATWRDVTDDRRRERELASSRDLLRSVSDAAGDATLVLDADLMIIRASDGMRALFGPAADRAVGSPVLLGVHPADRTLVDDALLDVRRDGRPRSVEFRVRSWAPGPRWRWLEGRAARVGDRPSCELHVVLRDVTAVHAEREVLGHLATHDPLTGLLNRAGLDELGRAGGLDGAAAVLFVDLDRFKPVNDTYGHRAGDDVLREVAARLRSVVREQDAVARLGGDEFVVVASGGSVPALERRIREVVRRPIRLADGTTITVTASVGSARPIGGDGVDELVERADRAMYADKRRAYARAG